MSRIHKAEPGPRRSPSCRNAASFSVRSIHARLTRHFLALEDSFSGMFLGSQTVHRQGNNLCILLMLIRSCRDVSLRETSRSSDMLNASF